jgi:amino acid adenylation domain-containing protein
MSVDGFVEGAAVRAGVAPRGEFLGFPLVSIEQSVPDRFEQQVDLYASRVAVQSRFDRLTYAELDGWANRIASAILAERGEGEEPIALLFEQGAAAIAAVLGVLKAGKIYVPLDPGHPSLRLAQMREWVGAELVVTDSLNADVARSLFGQTGRLLLVDRLRDGSDDGRPALPVSPDAVAYVFFTSGSTGAPKGVFDSHRNVLHNVRRYTNALAIGPDDRLTLLQSCAFSGSVSSLFGALLNGATAFPLDFGREGSAGLAEVLVRERLTMYHSVPSIFRRLATGASGFPDVRVIRLEGDRASSLDVALARRHFDASCIVANGLGTTETGLCRQYLIDPSVEVEEGILPVGYPVADMEVEILDENGRQLGPGEDGEIAVRSRYLALGYWQKPDLTDAAFHPTPAAHQRIYRTGDLGRLGADGCLEYLARKDFQLKVRGHRVDVAEVESELIAAPGVNDAIVTTFEKADGEAELVAYVVPEDRARLDPIALSRALRQRLPSHSVPTRLQQLQVLPLDGNGKVDRTALPAPEPAARDANRTAPRDLLERQLVEIWQEVLEVAPIGIDEAFLDLGGDSLAAAAVAARIETATGRRLPPVALRDSATVARLAETLRAQQQETRSLLVPIEPHGVLAPLFLVHDLMGEVDRYNQLARYLGPDQPVWALRCTFEPDTIELMAERYLKEIRRLRPSGPYHLGGWCFGAVVAFEIAHQLRTAGDEVALLALIGISAWDFRRLVTPTSWRRYRASTPKPPRQGFRSRMPLAARPASLLARSQAAFARYRPETYPGRAILILSQEETAAYSDDPETDWRALCTDGVDVLRLPGDHDAILIEPNVQAVSDLLQRLLHREGRGRADSTNLDDHS